MAVVFETQSKALRRLVLSTNRQSAWGLAAALPMAALTYDQRFDGSAVIDYTPTRRSDAGMSGKGSYFATNGQITSLDLKISGVKCEASAWTMAWVLAFCLGKDVVTGSAAPFTHTITFDQATRNAVPTTAFLQDTDGLVYFVPDLHVAKLTITIPDVGAMQIEFDFIGTGYLNILSGSALTTALAAVPAPPDEIYLLGSDCDFLMGDPGAPVSVNGRSRTSTVTVDYQSTLFRGMGTGLYGSFVKKGVPKFSISATIAATATDDIFGRMVGNQKTAFTLNAQSDAHAAFSVTIPQANLKTAKMGSEDDMIIWNVEMDEMTCYQPAGSQPITFTVKNDVPNYLTPYVATP